MNIEDNVKAFDAVSARYDSIESEPAFKVLRSASLRHLLRTFRQGKIVLDIGCGTGTEAIALAKQGVTVIGIDPSQGMIEQAEKKKQKEKISNAFFYRLSAHELAQVPAMSGFHRFDGAYSSLGSLNCEPILEPVGQALSGLLHPEAFVVASVFNTRCLAEMMVYAVIKPSRVFRRKGPFMAMQIGGQNVMLRLYSLNEIKDAFRDFKVQSTRALSFLVPPPHLSRRIPEDILQGLGILDSLTSRMWPFNRYGDYVSVTLKKQTINTERLSQNDDHGRRSTRSSIQKKP